MKTIVFVYIGMLISLQAYFTSRVIWFWLTGQGDKMDAELGVHPSRI